MSILTAGCDERACKLCGFVICQANGLVYTANCLGGKIWALMEYETVYENSVQKVKKKNIWDFRIFY